MPSATTGASSVERIEVVNSVQRRRRWTLGEKLLAVEESNVGGRSVSLVAQKYGICPGLLFRWRKPMAEGGKEAVRDDDVVGATEVRELKRKILELERFLCKKTIEAEILKEALELARPKKADLAHALAARGRVPVKAVADILGVARSNVNARLGGVKPTARSRYDKADDALLLPKIRALTDGRLTHGYQRACTVLNRGLALEGKSRGQTISASIASCARTAFCLSAIPASGLIECMKAGSLPCIVIPAGARTSSRYLVGTARWWGWPLAWTVATAR